MSTEERRAFPALQIVEELARCHLALARACSEPIIAGGLTRPQAEVLLALQSTHSQSFRQIGEATLITKGTLTGIIQRLEDKGLIVLEPNPQDARSRLVCLTETGAQTISAVLHNYGERVTETLSGMGLGQRKDLAQALGRLHRRITRNTATAS